MATRAFRGEMYVTPQTQRVQGVKAVSPIDAAGLLARKWKLELGAARWEEPQVLEGKVIRCISYEVKESNHRLFIYEEIPA